MAKANQKLQEQMDEAPVGHFDIERVDEAQRVIEMVSGTLTLCFTEGCLIPDLTLFAALSGCGAGGTQWVRE